MGQLLYDDDDYEEELEDEEEWENEGPTGIEVTGPSFIPSWTGLLDHKGEPIVRHPVAVRLGFYPERNKMYCPTMEEEDAPGADAVVGWIYD